MTTLLLTGGTGSFGTAFVKTALDFGWYDRIIVFSDNEGNQTSMRRMFPPSSRLDYFLGNVRSYERMREAMLAGVDLVIHAAAIKEVPTCEYNWPEAFETNVIGSKNVALAAIEANVGAVLLVSSDKATSATTGYGKTKSIAEEWFVRSNRGFGRRHRTMLGAVRYGNVLGSRASVVPLFQSRLSTGQPLPVTDLRMTRFYWQMAQAVRFVHMVADTFGPGEIWVPELKAASMLTLAQAVSDDTVVPTTSLDVVGIRGREKLHECMVDEDEARNTYRHALGYVIQPNGATWPLQLLPEDWRVEPGFTYRSDNPDRQMTIDELRTLL